MSTQDIYNVFFIVNKYNYKFYDKLSNLITFIVISLSIILFWASSNVCRFNFAIEKKTNLLNIVTQEIDPNLGNTKVYYYQELNCNNVDLNWSIDRVIKNFHALNVIIYQELTTDIKGNPN